MMPVAQAPEPVAPLPLKPDCFPRGSAAPGPGNLPVSEGVVPAWIWRFFRRIEASDVLKQ